MARRRPTAPAGVGGFGSRTALLMVRSPGKKKPPGCGLWRFFSGCLGACLDQSLRQRLGKVIKPKCVHAVHVECVQDGFKHESATVGKSKAIAAILTDPAKLALEPIKDVAAPRSAPTQVPPATWTRRYRPLAPCPGVHRPCRRPGARRNSRDRLPSIWPSAQR